MLGAVFGPLSFMGGVRLGGARFVDEPAALVTLACMWAVLMPLVMALSDRFDGVVVPEPCQESPMPDLPLRSCPSPSAASR